MNWQILKEQIYIWDGGWLDIYIFNTTIKDWEKWAQFVNENYKVSWYNGELNKTETKINFEVIKKFWAGNLDFQSTVMVFIGDIQVNAHFFLSTEIENDIDPREFNDMEDHNALIKYLKGISRILDKEVIVTPENCPEIVLISVKNEHVEITTDTDPSQWPIRIKE